MTAEQFFKKNPYRLGQVVAVVFAIFSPLLYAWELVKETYRTAKDSPYSKFCEGLGTYIKTGELSK